MKPLNPVMFAMAFAAMAAGVQNAASQADPAQEQLGISMSEAKDLCSYAKDVLYEGDNKYSWEEACGGAAPDIAKLRKLKDMDFMYRYNAALAATPARKQVVLGLKNILAGPDFSQVKDDSDRKTSQRVTRCMTKNDCLNVLKEDGELEDINPAITPRTFPAWLSAEEANRLLPFMVIAEDERLRNEKYRQLKVPLDEKERKAHCAVPANAAACAQFDKVQKQLGINKETLHLLKGIDDPKQFAERLLLEKGKQDAGGVDGSNTVVGQAGKKAADDSKLPIKPQQTLKIAAPPENAPGKPKQGEESLTDKAKKLGAAGTAAALAAGGALLAWGKNKLNERDAAKKAAAEVSQEDSAAASSGEFTKQSAEEALNPEEKQRLKEIRETNSTLDEYMLSRNTYGAMPPGLKSLAEKIRRGEIKP